MNVLAFAASNSRNSINKKLVTYAAGMAEAGVVDDAQVEIIDLNDYEMPLYSVDREQENGIPEQAQRFYEKIGDADALLIAFAEHNGFYTSAYKNLFDWTSRIDMKLYQDKPAVLLASSPGPRGGSHVLQVAIESAPFFGMDVRANLSIPRFYETFDMEQSRVKNAELDNQIQLALAKLN